MNKLNNIINFLNFSFKTKTIKSYWLSVMIDNRELTDSEAGYIFLNL